MISAFYTSVPLMESYAGSHSYYITNSIFLLGNRRGAFVHKQKGNIQPIHGLFSGSTPQEEGKHMDEREPTSSRTPAEKRAPESKCRQALAAVLKPHMGYRGFLQCSLAPKIGLKVGNSSVIFLFSINPCILRRESFTAVIGNG